MAAVIVPETCVPFFNSMVTVSFTSMHASTPILIQIDFLFIYYRQISKHRESGTHQVTSHHITCYHLLDLSVEPFCPETCDPKPSRRKKRLGPVELHRARFLPASTCPLGSKTAARGEEKVDFGT